MELTKGTVALHDQIADDLRERINSGELAPGDRLPPMRELQERWGCSDGPVRTAFAILRREGRIDTARGGPARVRVPQQRRAMAIALTGENASSQKAIALLSEDERRATGATELALGVPLDQTKFSATYTQMLAGRELADEFAIDPNEKLLRRSYRTTYKDSGLLALASDSYIPVALIRGNRKLLDAKNEPWPGGHWHQFYTVGIEIDRQSNTISAIQPTTRQRQDWGADEGVPFLRLRARSIDTENRIVEVADSVYPADQVEISYKVQLERW